MCWHPQKFNKPKNDTVAQAVLYRRCVSTTLYSPQFERKIAQLCFTWLPLSAPSPPEPTLSQNQQVENQNPEHLDDDKLLAFLKRKIYICDVRAAWRSCNVFTTSWIRAVQGQRVKRCPKEEEAGVKNLGDNKQAGRGRRVDWQRACFLWPLVGRWRQQQAAVSGKLCTNQCHADQRRTIQYIFAAAQKVGFIRTNHTNREFTSYLFFFLFLWVGGPHNGSADV